MPQLKICRSDREPRTIKLNPGDFRIGRHEDNDLILADQTVSRFHACIKMNDSLVYCEIENLSKTNPVFHNGRELRRQTILFDSDLIEIGVYQLQYIEG